MRDLPFKKALKWILLSTVLVSGSVTGGLLYWHHHQQSLLSDPHYTLVAIMQSCRDQEPLQTNYLAELLDLSVNRPTNLYRFNVQEAEQKLLASPLIKSAKIKKIKPGMLYIEYSLRKPIAYVLDYSNTAIDIDGVLIPFKPFTTPKKVPELILDLPACLTWGENVSGEKVALAHEIIKLTNEEGLNILKRIDVSKAFSKRCGEREIVLFFEDSNAQTAVRFSPQNWKKQLINYKKLRLNMATFPRTVDMRISQLAFITN